MNNKIEDINDLDLPSDPDFISVPPIYTAAEMIIIREAMLPYWNKQKLENPPLYTEWEAFTLDKD